MKKQKGLSLVSLIFTLAIGGFVLIYGVQMGLGYVTQQTLRGIVKNALMEAKNNDSASVRSIKEAIDKKLSVNTLDISSNVFDISRTGNGFEITTDYIKEVKITDKVKIVMDLSFTETTK